MRLAARMAMHVAAWQTSAASTWQPGTRADAWERGAMDAGSVTENEAAAPVSEAAPLLPVKEAVQLRQGPGMVRAVEAEARRPVAVRAVEGEVMRGLDATQVRGSAWSHGAYRLFVRGRSVPRATHSVRREPEIMPCFEPVRAPAALPASAAEVRTLRVGVAETLHVEAWRAEAAVAEAVRVEVVGASAVESPLVAAADGVVRRVVEWPIAAGARPGLLGGALTRLELPTAAGWRTLVPQLAGVPMPGEGGSPAVFLDVETTALDRGAGALAFMVGLAAFVGGVMRVEQWILSRLTAEPVMLAEVVERVAVLAGQGAVLASYNGASFDVPLLRARLQRARQYAQLGPVRSGLERPHVDLLHPARRMWQGRDRDCRLGTLERTRLGVRRVHDLAGHEIPAVFWAWLRRPGDAEVQALMQRAADHNLADLLVLPALGAAIGRCLTAPDDLEAAVRSAQHLVTCGRRDQALALLAGWHARPGPAPMRRRALMLAADLLRREGGAAGASALWREVCRISPGDPAAHEALAKHLEHRVGDLEQALTVAQGSAAPCPRRVARLQRKLGAPPAN